MRRWLPLAAVALAAVVLAAAGPAEAVSAAAPEVVVVAATPEVVVVAATPEVVVVAATPEVVVVAATPPGGAESCTGCHVRGGGIGVLQGRAAEDTVAVMEGFRSGARPATLMNRIVKGFTPEEVRALATWFASVPGGAG